MKAQNLSKLVKTLSSLSSREFEDLAQGLAWYDDVQASRLMNSIVFALREQDEKDLQQIDTAVFGM